VIYTHIPYCPAKHGKDLGYAYNKFMERLEDDDWAVFLDHDAMFTTYTWYKLVEKAIATYPGVGVFTGTTNRVFCKWQLANVSRGENDIAYHRDMGEKIERDFGIECSNMTNYPWMSGVVIIISKKCWGKIGGFASGMLGVDNQLHKALRKHKQKLFLIKGLYIYHWYSNHNLNQAKKRDVSHLREI